MSTTFDNSAPDPVQADPAPRASAGAGSAEAPAAAGGAPEAKPASHDTSLPEALVTFMLDRWAPAPRELPQPIAHAEVFAARRRALSKLFPAETLIIPTGHEKVRANDTHYRFRPGSDFFYLTGNLEPDCVLVMQPQEGGGHRDILFVEPNPGRSDKTFFTDRVKGELWVGPRLGVDQSRAHFGVDECRGLPELDAYLSGLVGAVTHPHRVLRGMSDRVDNLLAKQDRDKQLGEALSEMRLLKDALEIQELEAVVASTKRGFEDVIRALPAGRSEREVEGIFNLRARVEGNDVGYGTIAAAGHHACILHWTRNDGKLDPEKLLLIDAGVEGNSLYTADITRTLPIGGKFSPEQREIYELVLEAQEAALREVKPGNDFMEPNRAAMRVLARGLERLGILPVSAEEALKEDKQFYRRYSLHNVSHMLGLDVHDCAQARQQVYKFGKLQPGMVLTVEPGLYFQLDDETVPARYRGIGVRIEDDVLVTESGHRNLSCEIPRTVGDVEAWMAGIWAAAK
ncbi:Xaa-Pro aminopeptidase [Sorangium cellulosum]|uniref:Xaa-Pro aminopeptidase n=1 Tax=Sorangium cellulosum TaxID=56 RepID=A0A2L0FAJ0_SORCE|nr:aminopeptidase P family protein [Sorangium cellulosum]AUX48595.1 Xaa-Pro aminopeptidase [Sorangium cellulosum]